MSEDLDPVCSTAGRRTNVDPNGRPADQHSHLQSWKIYYLIIKTLWWKCETRAHRVMIISLGFCHFFFPGGKQRASNLSVSTGA